ncbi:MULTISPECIES: glycoside hydrolase family 3 N-terminal domain-containing protein [unclassified Thermotoga]|uniref:glycoside hydrolase family 3 N-terminal domain-containing protein n=1 Tax=unclassified Thermotoga TaxID=2631113 RepID=UPI000280E885|nr:MULTISPECIES: glycoside hydrolase family 3 N-terminal domain-containing protein [unclassified Thermotoga]AIY86058.1 glycoside hydrolase family 3 protein [Thermotoga sp. 2812B]EJX27034.1 glycoside hydrolase family 3 protein [Thermotoga sp. EMP]
MGDLEKKVSSLLSQMSLEEKIAQLGSVQGKDLIDEDGNFQVERAKELLKHGIGEVTRPGGSTNLPPEKVAELVNEIQRFLVEETRLGIPAIMHEECLAGYMGPGGTSFPQAIAMASTWDPDLIEKMASTIREDLRKMGVHQGLAPVLDVARDPRWGRTEETFGESPYLVAKMGVSYVKGLQGDIKHGVAATLKHFAGHGVPEGGRNCNPTNIPEREFREIFLLPFEAAIREAEALSVMNSYSEIDGVPCAMNRSLLTDILRKEWGFKGIVVADYGAVMRLKDHHKVAKDEKEAAMLSFTAGLDLELPSAKCYAYLKELVEEGILSESLIDVAVARVLKLKFMLGLFENPYVEVEKAKIESHRDIALEIARKSIILLKNDNILPLQKNKKVALIGPHASDPRLFFGDYTFLGHMRITSEGTWDSAVILPKVQKEKMKRIFEKELSKIPSIVDILKEEGIEFEYAKGCDVTGEDRSGFEEAIEVAKKSDVAIVVVGDKSGLTLDCTTGESRDMANLKLPGVQEELILEVAKTGKPIVLVLITGRPYSLKNVADKVNAILQVWLPGEAGGRAIVDIIYGRVNPSGKLPISFPRSAGQIPVFHYVKPSGGRSHWHGDYVDESTKPLFPFGHGLSYTKFEYSNLRIEPKEVPPAGEVVIKVDVENTGDRDGDEVVQLYIGREFASVTRPVKELKGFKRVSLKAKEKKTVVFRLHMDVLAYYDRDMKLVVEPGEFKVMVGSSSEDIRLTGSFTVVGEKREVVGMRKFFTEVDEK